MLPKIVGTGVVVLGFVKCMNLTVNDEWVDVKYSIKSMFSSSKQRDKPKIVVLGTGWGALSYLKHVDQRKVDITIVSPRSFFFYTPLLAGMATGTVGHSSITEPIRWYCNRTKASTQYIQGECMSVDVKKKQVLCQTGSDICFKLDYDHLVIAVGAEPQTFNIPGVAENAIFMKEIDDALMVQHKILQQLEKANSLLTLQASEEDIRRELNWVIVGGGPTGVELTGELTDFIRQDVSRYFPQLQKYLSLTLVEATDRLLGAFDPQIAQYAQNILEENNATVLTRTAVTRVDRSVVDMKHMASGDTKSVAYGMLVWVAGVRTRPITRSIISQLDPSIQNSRWGLVVTPHMSVAGTDGSVWALGDCSVTAGCPPTAQVAYQQGKYLGRLMRDTDLRPEAIDAHEPFKYEHGGSLAYIGSNKGVAELKTKLWDHYPLLGNDQICVEGTSAFAIWRSLYFSKLMSERNRAMVLFDWLKTFLFGRDISSSHVAELRPVTEEMKHTVKK